MSTSEKSERSGEKWAQYWVNKFLWALDRRGDVDQDDLMQAARIGIWEAQKTYKPDLGAWSTYSAFWIRREIRRALGVKSGKLPPPEIHLDEPITWDAEETRLDMLADDSIPDMDSVVDDQARVVREAVERLDDPQQREVIHKKFYERKTENQIAEEMNIEQARKVYGIWVNARRRLRRDKYLRELHSLSFHYHINVSVARFNTTRTSSVEEAVIRYYSKLDDLRRKARI